VHDDKQPFKNCDQVVLRVLSNTPSNKLSLVRWSHSRGKCTVANPDLKKRREWVSDKSSEFNLADYNLSNHIFKVHVVDSEIDDKAIVREGVSRIWLIPQMKASEQKMGEFKESFGIWWWVLNEQLTAPEELQCYYSETGSIIELRERRKGDTMPHFSVSEKLNEAQNIDAEFVLFCDQEEGAADESKWWRRLLFKLFGCTKIRSESAEKKNFLKKIRKLEADKSMGMDLMDDNRSQYHRNSISSVRKPANFKAASFPRAKSYAIDKSADHKDCTRNAKSYELRATKVTKLKAFKSRLRVTTDVESVQKIYKGS